MPSINSEMVYGVAAQLIRLAGVLLHALNNNKYHNIISTEIVRNKICDIGELIIALPYVL